MPKAKMAKHYTIMLAMMKLETFSNENGNKKINQRTTKKTNP